MEIEDLRSPPAGDFLAMDRLRRSPFRSRFHPPRIVGAGLSNLGNTCFLNAVLQCITHTVPLVERLVKVPCLSGEDEGFCSLCALKKHVGFSIWMSGRFFSPVVFADNLSKISSYLKLGEQEDAHEFLNSLLDRLHNCCVGPSPKGQPCSLEQDSLVKQVFGGRLRSQLRCCDCGHSSDTLEPLIDISLEIDDVNSLTEALQSFTKVEKIEDPEAKLTCQGCKGQVAMEKQLKLDRAPTVIILHLKRFKNYGSFIDKIDKFINYPLELDLKPYLSSPEGEEQSNYDLYATVVHHGSAGYGHYYSTVRSSPMAWHVMDDSKVTRVSEACVLDQNAYILFYVKQGTSPWFSDFMQTQEMPCRDLEFEDSPISVLGPIPRCRVSYSIDSSEDSSSDSLEIEVRRDHDASHCGADDMSEKPATDELTIQTTSPHSPGYANTIIQDESAEIKARSDHDASPCTTDDVAEKTVAGTNLTHITRPYTPDNAVVFEDEAAKIKARRDHDASPYTADDVAEKARAGENLTHRKPHTTEAVMFEDEPAKTKARTNHDATSCTADDVAEKAPADINLTQTPRPHTPHYDFLFEDEPLGDEKDDLMPQASVGWKKVPVRPIIQDTGDDPRLKQFAKCMRNMPSARKAGLLACFADQDQIHKRAQTQPCGNNKRRKPWDSGDVTRKRSSSRHSLSPRSIRRGLF